MSLPPIKSLDGFKHELVLSRAMNLQRAKESTQIKSMIEHLGFVKDTLDSAGDSLG